MRMCGSPPPDGSQVDSVRGQFDQTDGYGLALPVRSELNADTAVGRHVVTRSSALQPVGNRAQVGDLCPSFLRATSQILSYKMSYKRHR